MEEANKTAATTAKKAAKSAAKTEIKQEAQQVGVAAESARKCGNCVFSFDRSGRIVKCSQAPAESNERETDASAEDCVKYEGRK